jgi:hypothetical protein
MVRGGGGVPVLGGRLVSPFAPESVELGRERGGAVPLPEGATEAARRGGGVAVAGETAPVADLPGEAV